MSSRDLNDLAPHVREKAQKHLQLCAEADIDLLIYCTYRSAVEQDALYCSGRTVKGAVVTMCRGGQSWHNLSDKGKPASYAYDCVPMRGGKPVWTQNNDADRTLWQTVGKLGEQAGLQWAGRWTGALRETAHFEDTRGQSIATLWAAQGGKNA